MISAQPGCIRGPEMRVAHGGAMVMEEDLDKKGASWLEHGHGANQDLQARKTAF